MAARVLSRCLLAVRRLSTTALRLYGRLNDRRAASLMDPASLIGFWSDDLLHSGAMEREVVFFAVDCRGCYAFENLGGTQGSVFAWELNGDRLTVRTLQEFAGPLHEPLGPGEGLPFDLDAARVTVGVEDVLDGARSLVLRIDTGRAPRPWPPFTYAYGYVDAACPDDLRGQIESSP